MLPTSLEILNLAGGDPDDDGTPHKFTGGIPPEWGALTNLKELEMANCGLDGKLLSTRSELVSFASVLPLRDRTWHVLFLPSFGRREGSHQGETFQLPHLLLNLR